MATISSFPRVIPLEEGWSDVKKVSHRLPRIDIRWHCAAIALFVAHVLDPIMSVTLRLTSILESNAFIIGD